MAVNKVLEGLKEKGYVHCNASSDLSLSDEVLSSLQQEILLSKDSFKKSGIGQGSEIHSEIRGDYIRWADESSLDGAQRVLHNFLSDLKKQLNENFFLGIEEVEFHLTFYPVGTFYQTHLDTFKADKESKRYRKVSFVFYLNKDWVTGDGGELVLYNSQHEELLKVAPKFGSVIFFLSEEFPHEVLTNHKERLSLTGWMK